MTWKYKSDIYKKSQTYLNLNIIMCGKRFYVVNNMIFYHFISRWEDITFVFHLGVREYVMWLQLYISANQAGTVEDC